MISANNNTLKQNLNQRGWYGPLVTQSEKKIKVSNHNLIF